MIVRYFYVFRSDVGILAPRTTGLMILDVCLFPLQLCIILMGLDIFDTAIISFVCLTAWFLYDIASLMISCHRIYNNNPTMKRHQLVATMGLSIGLCRVALFFKNGAQPFLLCYTVIVMLPILLSSCYFFLYVQCIKENCGRAGCLQKLGMLYTLMLPVVHIFGVIWRLVECWLDPCSHPVTSWTFSYLPTTLIIALIILYLVFNRPISSSTRANNFHSSTGKTPGPLIFNWICIGHSTLVCLNSF